MDFFQNQERARRASRVLLVLYAASVLGIVAAVNALLRVLFLWGAAPGTEVPIQLYAIGTLGTLALILGVTAFQVERLSAGGGDAVARMAGARRIAFDTREPLERLLVNVVEELAIASGVRVPNVYVMDAERGINAFAAGYDASHAVIAVTRGALERLNRDELQGVVAHEFSHILNGDMRLNIDMLGVLAGIVFIGAIGRFLMHGAARARGRHAAPVAIAGGALFAIGSIGLLFSQLIKAAVSRQREFLADASSVQFTRNPDGIAGALDQISLAGSGVANRYAEDMSHMYFARSAAALFATHPPLAARIRRAHPGFDAQEYRRRRARALSPAPTTPAAKEGRFAPRAALALVGALAPGTIDVARRMMAAVPAAVHGRIETAEGAAAFLVALSLSTQAAERARQMEAVTVAAGRALADEALALAAAAQRLPLAHRLPAIDLALPALKAAPAPARAAALAALEASIRADQHLSLHELVVLTLVREQLAGAPRSTAGNKMLQDLHASAQLVRSLFAEAAGKPSADAVQEALEELKALAPGQKALLVQDLLAAACAGGGMRIAEAELLRMVGAVLDCPLPPMQEGV